MLCTLLVSVPRVLKFQTPLTNFFLRVFDNEPGIHWHSWKPHSQGYCNKVPPHTLAGGHKQPDDKTKLKQHFAKMTSSFSDVLLNLKDVCASDEKQSKTVEALINSLNHNAVVKGKTFLNQLLTSDFANKTPDEIKTEMKLFSAKYTTAFGKLVNPVCTPAPACSL